MSSLELQRERYFFLEKNNKRIYCGEYIPEKSKNRKIGLILCKPLWGERIRTHAICTNMARMLCEDGYFIITCDYYGDGNSGGDTLDLDYSSMVDDVRILYEHLDQNRGIDAFALIGLRIGANCALASSSYMQDLKKIIMIEPIPDLLLSLKTGLRSNLSNQMIIYKEIRKNRDDLIQDIINGVPVNMDGFLICKDLYCSFEKADLLENSDFSRCPLTVITLDKKSRVIKAFESIAKRLDNVVLKAVEKEFYWTEWKINKPRPPRLFQMIRDELCTENVLSGQEFVE